MSIIGSSRRRRMRSSRKRLLDVSNRSRDRFGKNRLVIMLCRFEGAETGE